MVPPEPPHQGPDMGEPDALAGLVLRAGAAKQVEDPLMILRIDAATVVGDLENREAELRPAADVRCRPGTPGLRYFSALSIRLEKICSSARRSLTMSGSGSIWMVGLRLAA